MQPSSRWISHPPDGPNRGRLPHLDALRAIAALLVVAHHAHFECSMDGTLGRLTGWMREGHFLVTFFIILSGFCLTLPTLGDGRLSGGFLGYIRRRAWRLLPAYYAALIGSLGLIAWVPGMGSTTGRHWDFALPIEGPAIVSHALLVHNYEGLHLYKINHVFWSIAVEWQVYFAMPLLLLATRRVGPWWAAGAAVACGMAGYAGLAGSPHFGLTPHYYGMFAVGMLAATVAHSPRCRQTRADVSWWTLGGLALVAAGSMIGTSPREVVDLPFGVACGAMLVALSRPGRVRAWLEHPRWVALGGFSYSVYLVHAPLQHLIVDRLFARIGLPASLEFPALLLGGTPAILAVAYLFHRAFERPFLPTRRARLLTGPMGLGAASDDSRSGRVPEFTRVARSSP